ncbi:MAG: type 4a pilus biogenesis protein PilO [Nitrospirota bacterium]
MKKNRYIFIVFLFIVAVFVFENYFLEPEAEIMRESISAQYNALQKYEQFIKGAGATEEEIKSAIDDIKKIEKKLIDEKSEFLASARLQSEISGITSRAGLRILTVRPLSAVKINNYINIPLFIEGNGDIKQIGDFLKYVESGNLMIKIDKLNLNITNIQNPKELKFKIQLSGLVRA